MGPIESARAQEDQGQVPFIIGVIFQGEVAQAIALVAYGNRFLLCFS